MKSAGMIFNTDFSLSPQDLTRGIDTSLTLKLQKRLTELEQEKQSLRNELENKEEQFQRARARVLTRTHAGRANVFIISILLVLSSIMSIVNRTRRFCFITNESSPVKYS